MVKQQQQAKQQQQQQQKHHHPKMPVKTPKASPPKTAIWEADNDVDFEDLTFVVPIVISAILLIVFFIRMYIRWTVRCQSNNRLEGKTVVVTGANSGIGKATSTELARRGARVILACRDQAKGEAVARMIRQKTKNDDVHAYHLDLGSQTSIREFVEDFNNREASLHCLINNAAYMGPKATTEEGYERCFGVNYLGHFYLTHLLTDKLKRGAPSRVINVVSDAYTKAKLDFEDLALANYDLYRAYARSKLALMMFNTECHRRLSGEIVHSYGVHPGCVCTDLLRNWPGVMGNILRTLARVMFKSPEDGCQTVVFCAVADKLREHSGKVFENCSLLKVKDYVRDKEKGRQLWNISLHLCGLQGEEDESTTDDQNSSTKADGVKGSDEVHSETKKDK